MLEVSPAHVLWSAGSCAGKPAEAIEESVDFIAQVERTGGPTQVGQGELLGRWPSRRMRWTIRPTVETLVHPRRSSRSGESSRVRHGWLGCGPSAPGQAAGAQHTGSPGCGRSAARRIRPGDRRSPPPRCQGPRFVGQRALQQEDQALAVAPSHLLCLVQQTAPLTAATRRVRGWRRRRYFQHSGKVIASSSATVPSRKQYHLREPHPPGTF